MTARSRRPSRQLSWLLRHGASAAGLAMDEAGWASVDDVVNIVGLTAADLVVVVEADDKDRLELVGGRIRACQGHSLEGMPVTLEALEASWRGIAGDGLLWHGTRHGCLPGIAERGILPGRRSHVHLAEGPHARVGKRASAEVLLAVAPARLRASGLAVFRASNGVVLVRHVPVHCIVGATSADAAEVQLALQGGAGAVSWPG